MSQVITVYDTDLEVLSGNITIVLETDYNPFFMETIITYDEDSCRNDIYLRYTDDFTHSIVTNDDFVNFNHHIMAHQTTLQKIVNIILSKGFDLIINAEYLKKYLRLTECLRIEAPYDV